MICCQTLPLRGISGNVRKPDRSFCHFQVTTSKSKSSDKKQGKNKNNF